MRVEDLGRRESVSTHECLSNTFCGLRFGRYEASCMRRQHIHNQEIGVAVKKCRDGWMICALDHLRE